MITTDIETVREALRKQTHVERQSTANEALARLLSWIEMHAKDAPLLYVVAEGSFRQGHDAGVKYARQKVSASLFNGLGR